MSSGQFHHKDAPLFVRDAVYQLPREEAVVGEGVRPVRFVSGAVVPSGVEEGPVDHLAVAVVGVGVGVVAGWIAR